MGPVSKVIFGLALSNATWACPARATTLMEAIRGAGDGVWPVIEHLIAAGQTTDLSNASEVEAAIGRLDRDVTVGRFPGFVRYTFGRASQTVDEIVYNARAMPGYVLLVRLRECVPLAALERRLIGPEFAPGPRPITVVQYTFVPFAARRIAGFTHVYGTPCVSSLGIAQSTRPDPSP